MGELSVCVYNLYISSEAYISILGASFIYIIFVIDSVLYCRDCKTFSSFW